MARPKKIPSIAVPDELDAEEQLQRIHAAWKAWLKLDPQEKLDVALDPRLTMYDRSRNAENERDRQNAALSLDQMLRPRLKPVETIATREKAEPSQIVINLPPPKC